ncbi:LOW QUALITY PROTEIN: membrane-bound transcription factor site-2 protease-like [Gigantopelta aegis]|uniref:LOW QUALITY PROTEIN: membrane-bound transcription factor site-2 protease-like n=1 Tax=Gigantopelta aegis TaxID=1735272 RepID=UPI001B88BCC4|nr:LOW QUALITY PROTEIN: membrane-bound transcription factor site-2 protease-like [Gigantopelta aegis]
MPRQIWPQYHIWLHALLHNTYQFPLQIVGCCNRRIARTWFNIGVAIGLSLMVLSVLVLLFSLYQALFSQSKNGNKVLIPVMPGVNVPWSQITHYFFTLVICGVFHEVGHALAAVTEQVVFNGFGLFIFFLYPGAFVDLHSDHLTVISPKRQLRIYCAGVWHNIILSLLVFLFSLALPYLLLPFYTTGNGAVVINIAQDSVLQNKLSPGVVLTQLDSCSVHTQNDWSSCLQDKLPIYKEAMYISKEFLDNQKTFLTERNSQTLTRWWH